MSLQEWKNAVSQSSHVRQDETVTFNESSDGKLVYANIVLAPWHSIFLGAYSLTDRLPRFKKNHGWYHK